LFKQKTGVKLVHVPYKGDAPAVADLLAGHVNVMFGNVAQASAHLRSGKLKVLAVTSAKRITSMPNIPAMQEIVPGVVAVAWFAMVAPPKTPTAIVNRLSSLIGEILRTPEMMRRFAEVGAEPVGNTPEEMAQWMKEDTERWRQVIKTGGVTID
jgi:tripartite-type tricarboxylate transporter receptor subunit TctC